MEQCGSDWTNIFRSLSKIEIPKNAESIDAYESITDYLIAQSQSLAQLLRMNKPRVPLEKLMMMQKACEENPLLLTMMQIPPEFISSELERHKQFEKLNKMTKENKQEIDKSKWIKWIKEYKKVLLYEVTSKK